VQEARSVSGWYEAIGGRGRVGRIPVRSSVFGRRRLAQAALEYEVGKLSVLSRKYGDVYIHC
jgi:hypothetical protein